MICISSHEGLFLLCFLSPQNKNETWTKKFRLWQIGLNSLCRSGISWALSDFEKKKIKWSPWKTKPVWHPCFIFNLLARIGKGEIMVIGTYSGDIFGDHLPSYGAGIESLVGEGGLLHCKLRVRSYSAILLSLYLHCKGWGKRYKKGVKQDLKDIIWWRKHWLN